MVHKIIGSIALLLLSMSAFAQGNFMFNQHGALNANIVMTMSTTSTSATWSPQAVSKTGATLHWEVTGAVTTSVDENDPTFDFSTAGTKNIVVTSSDGASGFTSFNCASNSLTSLGLLNSTSLGLLNCASNSLSSLDVSNNTSLYYLYCASNSLSSLDVSNNINLTSLYCDSNSLDSLDVSNNTSLINLQCSSNSLSSLDVSNNTSLDYLSCASNSLSSLDVSNNINLTSLYCDSNSLDSLDVSNNTSLINLWCRFNSLTSLGVSSNTDLTSLYCDSNSLTKISVDNILDDLISFGLDGSTFNCSDQDPAITPDATKVSDLRALGWTVYQ
jgi:Leucine-rich repeat (LRR) protein